MGYPSFSAGDTLAASDMNAVGLWKITTATASGTSRALVVDNIFTTDYSHYRVTISLTGAVNVNALYYQYLDTSGSTVATGYYGSAYGQDFTSGATGFTVATLTTLQYLGYVPNSASATLTGTLDIYNPRSSTLVTSVTGQVAGIASGFSYLGGQVLGMTTGTTAFRGIRFDSAGGGNLTGTVRVYGYRN